MPGPLPHERPAWLWLPPTPDLGASVGRALARALARPDVTSHALPPLWCLDAAGLDLPGALPGVAALTRESLPEVLAAVERLCTPAVLDTLVRRTWREADEPVRQHFLQAGGRKMGALKSMAALLGFARTSRDTDPPPAFVAEQVFTHRVECQYRLAREPLSGEQAGRQTPAPPEEGSLIVYPFDLRGRHAAGGSGDPGDGLRGGGLVECFAYVWQHERHVAFWRALAQDLGARLDVSAR